MKVFREISPNKGIALALGYFDGVHTGHKKIITTLLKETESKGLKTAVVTFLKNPAGYFSTHPIPNIQTSKERSRILNSLGIDYLYELDFEKYKELSAEEYLKDVLVKNFSPEIIVVGYNHTFGKNKSGNPAFLKENSKKYNYNCIIVPEQKIKGEYEVSSTLIRQKIANGEISDLKDYLGRFFSVDNSVIKGKQLARELGYPTANLNWPIGIAKLPYGAYFGYIQYETNQHPALISWGTKPTVEKTKEEVLEAHIFNFNGDLYDKRVKVSFVKKIRDQKDFGSIEQLKSQLQKDYTEFKNWIKALS